MIQMDGTIGGVLLGGVLSPSWSYLSITGSTALSLALLPVVSLAVASRYRRLLPATSLNPLLLLYLIFTMTAFFVSPLPTHSLPRLITVSGGMIVLLALYVWIDSYTRLVWLVRGVVLAGGVVALIGLLTVEWPYQYLYDLRPWLSRLPRLPGIVSISPNALAGLLVLLIPLTWTVRRSESSRFFRFSLYLAGGIMVVMLLLVQSRNGWLALLAAWVAYRLWGRLPFAVLAIPLGLLIILPFTLNLWPEQARARLEEHVALVDDATKSGEADEPSWLCRLEIWRVAGQMIADYPALGAGLYAFDPVSRANYTYAVVAPEAPLVHSHNWFLQTATSLGVLGALLLAGIWGVTLWGLWQQRPQWPSVANHLPAVVGAALVGCLCFNVFDLSAWEQKGGVFIWFLLAMALRLSSERPVLPLRVAGVIFIVWLLLLASPVGQENRQRLRMDRAHFAADYAKTSRPMAPE
jgi:O-antigen ligase